MAAEELGRKNFFSSEKAIGRQAQMMARLYSITVHNEDAISSNTTLLSFLRHIGASSLSLPYVQVMSVLFDERFKVVIRIILVMTTLKSRRSVKNHCAALLCWRLTRHQAQRGALTRVSSIAADAKNQLLPGPVVE